MTRERIGSNVDWPEWLHVAWNKEKAEPGSLFPDVENKKLFCGTLEGVHEVSEGDFIIQGIKGEIYPCKPDIFEKTYDKVD